MIGILSGSVRAGPFRGSIMKGITMSILTGSVFDDINETRLLPDMDEAERETTLDILREVRGMIADPYAWLQDSDIGHEGRYTLYGALDEAVDSRLSDTDDWDILARESEELTVPCKDALADQYELLPGWETEFATMCEFNDYEGHDHAVIIGVVDRAIEALEGESNNGN